MAKDKSASSFMHGIYTCIAHCNTNITIHSPRHDLGIALERSELKMLSAQGYKAIVTGALPQTKRQA